MADGCTYRACFTRDLNADERSEIIALCESSHGTDFQRLFAFLPPDGLHVIAYLDGRMVGHAVRTTRWAQPEGSAPLKTAYIDAVSTEVALQGRGIGSAVMRRLAEEIRAEDYRLCALETSDRAGFYTRLGWEVWRGALAGRGPEGLIPTPEARGSVLILRLESTPELNLDGLLSIEQQGRIW